MRWNVKGVVAKTGQDMTIVLNARSKDEAKALAAARGMKVVALRPEAPVVRVRDQSKQHAPSNDEVAAALASEPLTLASQSLAIPSSPLLDDASPAAVRSSEKSTEPVAYVEILMAARWLRVLAMLAGCFGWLALGGGIALLVAPITKARLSQIYASGDLMPDTILLVTGLGLLLVANLVQAGGTILIAVRDMARKNAAVVSSS